jgi:peptidyl-tRNA hydrolase, PTH1 family
MRGPEPANYLIVGLGNPGKTYRETRHNIGFKVIEAFAESKNVIFRKEKDFKGELGKGTESTGTFWLLKPLTYMNLSGEAVKACRDFYRIKEENILVVSDDFELPFGSLRLRAGGSSGGHNGLKSIEFELGTREYPRLRCGIDKPQDPVTDYVLGEFSDEERRVLPEFIERAVHVIDTWLLLGIEQAIRKASSSKEKGLGDSKDEKGKDKAL